MRALREYVHLWWLWMRARETWENRPYWWIARENVRTPS